MTRRAPGALSWLLVLGVAVTVPAGAVVAASSAAAEPSAAAARREAAAAAAAVTAATGEVALAQEALARQQQLLATSVSASVSTQVQADRAQSVAAGARARTTQRVRSIYMDGDTGAAGRGLALLTSVVSGTDPAVALRGMAAARRVDVAGQSVADARSAQARAAAEQAGAGATDAVAGLRDVAARVSSMTDALAAAQQRLAGLDAEAARLQAAEDAAAALAAAAAQASALNSGAAASAATVHSRAVPVGYADLYRRAARTCSGMRPALLAAVGQVESGHGVNVGPSSAGAVGPMQFMPATFAAYGVDGDGDGDVEASDPADAVFSAARYLCANGAGAGREGEAGAVYRYNHADWYVAMVQRVADELEASGWG